MQIIFLWHVRQLQHEQLHMLQLWYVIIASRATALMTNIALAMHVSETLRFAPAFGMPTLWEGCHCASVTGVLLTTKPTAGSTSNGVLDVVSQVLT